MDAGGSIWNWTGTLPEERIRTYGRLNRSIGINGSVLNNVNANPQILAEKYLQRVAQIADILREYGIRTYLSINFASPMALGECATADPLTPEVQAWWQAKVGRIYELIPDFGGFLVKASSEGQPGPQDFGRSHADGANMLADALAPHGGIVMWRSFVYSATSPDRAGQAVEEFKPLDGQFRDNVIVQIKNGPVDFQPREPVSPLFFNMKETAMMPELQVTQEYLGQAWHLTYLGTMWEEFFEGLGSFRFPAIAGVANTGDDSSWCSHIFSQANWYAFGRLAWNPDLSASQIADEWIRGTFRKPWWATERRFTEEFVEPVKDMMMRSRYENLETCPEELLLWFHHIPWDYRLGSGRTIWDEICLHYDKGISEVEDFIRIWSGVRRYVDKERWEAVMERLLVQEKDARWWGDACVQYFGKFSGMQVPADVRVAELPLD